MLSSYMSLFKKEDFRALFNGNLNYTLGSVLKHTTNYPAPVNLTFSWTFGSLAMFSLIVQIVSGLCLTMHYVPDQLLAFDSVEHIMRDVRGGHIIRYVHANGASLYFISIYLHILRSLYYKNFLKNATVWNVGVIIFFLSITTAFLGYILPWGQMSFWAATVITNLFSVIPAIGSEVVYTLWGGFGVGNPTLNRFYTLHFLLPFVILALVIIHILLLHEKGSCTPFFLPWGSENTSFGGQYILKDVFIISFILIGYILIIIIEPNMLNHPDNYIQADPMQTPAHIVPEWYFLPFYAILRAIPNKSLGVLAMAAAILILFVLPLLGYKSRINTTPCFLDRFIFWAFTGVAFALGYLGSKSVVFPYPELSWSLTILYFSLILLIAGANLMDTLNVSDRSKKFSTSFDFRIDLRNVQVLSNYILAACIIFLFI